MSLLAFSLAIKEKTNDPLSKLLLMLLADRHNADTGDCFPSISRLVEDSSMSRSTVLRKLRDLEEKGFITTDTRRRPNGSRASNAYTLNFVPRPDAPEERKTREKPETPPANWWPSEAAITKVKERYPHHDTSEETIAYLVREWLQYCEANARKYVRFDAAWLQSAERYYRRQPIGRPALRVVSAGRKGAGSLSGAIRRFHGSTR